VETRRSEARQESKAYYDELIVLEELQTKAVLRLMKKLLIETVVAGEPISKEKLTSEIKRSTEKTEAIQNQ
jgi:RNase H-fold protein (predicted Holliday junction resolvase)